MPPAEIPSGKDMAANIDEPLTDEQRRQISELFEDIELAHKQLACTCSLLAILSRSSTGIVTKIKHKVTGAAERSSSIIWRSKIGSTEDGAAWGETQTSEVNNDTNCYLRKRKTKQRNKVAYCHCVFQNPEPICKWYNAVGTTGNIWSKT